MKSTLKQWIAAAACALTGSAALALPVSEVGDAGDLLAGAQITSGPLLEISGSLSRNPNGPDPTDYVDMYRIVITDPATFTVTTNGTLSDPVLFLFNAAGEGVAMNDDDPSGLNGAQSLIASLGGGVTSGVYYLAIAFAGLEPFAASFAPLFDTFGSQSVLTVDALASWGGEPLATNLDIPGGYTISITQVPAPGVLLLVLLGAAGLVGVRRARVSAVE
jgi:hypothetical protein